MRAISTNLTFPFLTNLERFARFAYWFCMSMLRGENPYRAYGFCFCWSVW